MSRRLQERNREARDRATEAVAAAAGLTVDQYRAAILAAYVCWRARRPWRWLPAPVAGGAFVLMGGRYAARFIAQWRKPEDDGE